MISIVTLFFLLCCFVLLMVNESICKDVFLTLFDFSRKTYLQIMFLGIKHGKIFLMIIFCLPFDERYETLYFI